MFDGDTVFALATGRTEIGAAEAVLGGPGRAAAVDAVGAAAADVFARAVVRGVLTAHSLPGLPAYRDVWPGTLG
jgi:L-aminopeptidase/D-esterase-like protein